MRTQKLDEMLRLRGQQARFRHRIGGNRLPLVLANPDFVTRVKIGAPLNDAQRETFFGGDARGYVDYPALSGAAAA